MVRLIKEADLAALDDMSAASLMTNTATQTHAALKTRARAEAVAAMSEDANVVAAAVAATSTQVVKDAAVQAAAFPRRALVSGEDLNQIRSPGIYDIPSTTIAGSLINYPFGSFTGQLFVGRAQTGNFTHQRIVALTSTAQPPQSKERVTRAIANDSWTPWTSDGTAPIPEASNEVGLTNLVLREDWSRRRGGKKVLTTGAFSFRIDHGLAPWWSKGKPLVDARGIKYSAALCSGQWDRAENVGVTAAMVNAEVTAGRLEIWNHTKDHGSGDNSEAAWKAAILDGLTELRTQLPAAQIDGFVIPGSTGTNFGGFVNGGSAAEIYGTAGGRFILEHHAVTNGYIPLTGRRVLDGTVRQGQGHYTLDAMTVAAFKTQVDLAIAEKSGLQVMLHPTRLDTAGYLTTADFTQMLDYVAQKRDAGQLAVLGQYDLLLADTSAARAS